ncbi:MAG: hotdog domain-containing protein [Dehalococcoidia bacterium]|nr:hotdog domain-containing protein [Dehalococcoidia bacterium]
MVNAETYPPPDHILRDLNILLEYKGKGNCTARIPVVPAVCNDRGFVQVGVLAALIDLLGGVLAAKVVHPDWIATAEMSVYSTQRATGNEVVAAGSVLRAGRAAVVIEAQVLTREGRAATPGTLVGSAVATFSRLPHREGNLDIGEDDGAHQVAAFTSQGAGLRGTLLDKAGLIILDERAGVVELGMSQYVRNSFGALQGGVVALMADIAGQCAARAAAQKPVITTDLAIHYLTQGKTGPFRTATNVLRATAESVLTRIEVLDRAAGDLLVAAAVNAAAVA